MAGLEERVTVQRELAGMVASQSDSSISTGELRRRFADPGLTIVDVRALAAYTGWRLKGETRGGHITGAVAFPSAWLTSVDDAEILRLFRAKNIVASQEIVLYGDGFDDVAALAHRLADLGCRRVRIYDRWDEWAADETLAVERLPNYQWLVYSEWLRELLNGRRPEAAPAGTSSSSTSISGCQRSARRTTCPERFRHQPPRESTRLEPPLAAGA